MDLHRIKHINEKLKIIASIGSQQKINTRNNEIYNNTIISSVSRTINTLIGYKGSSREDLYIMLDEVFREAFSLIKKYKDHRNQVDISIINGLISNVIAARNNMTTEIKATYSTDKQFIARLETLAQILDIQIDSISNGDIENSELLQSKLN